MEGRLAGRIALVTGGSRGIGEAIAEGFVRQGAHVVITSRKQDGLDAVAARLNAIGPGEATARACHVGQPEDIEDLFRWIDAEVGLVEVLVNNAGTNPYLGPMLNTPLPAWDKTFDVNLKGPFLMAREVALRLMEAGKGGSIVQIASIFGHRASPMQGVYGLTKAAMLDMTRTLAVELGGAGIRVNSISPGMVETRLAAAIVENESFRKMYADRAALGRHGQPVDLAGVALFLASDESAWITGQDIVVDGGYLMAS